MAGRSTSIVKKPMGLNASTQFTLSLSTGLVVIVGHPSSCTHAQSQYEPSLTGCVEQHREVILEYSSTTLLSKEVPYLCNHVHTRGLSSIATILMIIMHVLESIS